jgi:N-acetylneuraminic acid mutarotase
MLLRLFAAFALTIAAVPVTAGDWQDHAPLPMPIANNAVTTHVLNDTAFVYTFMGIDSTKIWSGISLMAARLNTVTNTWQTLPDTPAPPGEIAASAVTLGDVIYVIGGYRVSETGAETTSPRVFRFDPVAAAWIPRAADVPTRVDDMVAGVWADSLIYLISGWSFSRNVEDVQFYDPASDTWGAATPLPDFGTFGAVGGVCGDHLVFIDGVADTASFGFDLVNRVLVGTINPNDPTDVTWEDRGPHPGAPVYRGASWNLPGDDSRILIAGGTDNPYNFDGMGYDGNPSEPLGQVWSYHVPTGTTVFHADKPVPTMDHRGFPPAGGRLWTVGGMEAGQMVTDRVSSWLPDPVTGVLPVSPLATFELRVGPNPARTHVRFFSPRPNVALEDARIHDVSGRTVRSFSSGQDLGAGFTWDLRDDSGRRVGAGVYWLHGRVSGRPVARSVTVLDPR